MRRFAGIKLVPMMWTHGLPLLLKKLWWKEILHIEFGRDESLLRTEQDIRYYNGKSTILKLYMKRFLDPNPPVKKLWRNLDSVGTRETMEYNIIYTPDKLNTFLATPQTVRPPTEEFAFINTFEMEVYNALHQIRANAIDADGVPIKFQKITLTYILPYVTSYPAPWKLSKIMPISILPALSKVMEIIMRNQITAHIERSGMMSRLQSGFRSNHSPPKKNEWTACGFRGETYIYTLTAGLLESFWQCGSSAPLL
jgi:hypothetical protein